MVRQSNDIESEVMLETARQEQLEEQIEKKMEEIEKKVSELDELKGEHDGEFDLREEINILKNQIQKLQKKENMYF